MVRRKIVWDKPALQALQAAYDYIKKDSLQNAELVRLDLLDMTQRLEFHSERHPPDKFKTNNDGTYRAFEKHSYRITYKIVPQQVIILRVRHVKQEPLPY